MAAARQNSGRGRQPVKPGKRKKAPAPGKRPVPKKAKPKDKSRRLDEYRKKRKFASQRVVSVSGALALFVMFVVVIVYIVRGFIAAAEKPVVATVAVEYGSIDLPKEQSGVIIRQETVYESNAAGTLHFNYDDLSKVKKGSRIARIQDEEAVEQLNDSLLNAQAQILSLQDRREDISGFSQDVKRTNKQIQDIMDNNRRQFIGGNIAAVYGLREDVERNMNIRNNMLLTEERGSVKEMVDAKSDVERRLSESVSYINALESGVLCYTVDGQERLLTFDNLGTITPEQARMTVDYTDIDRKRQVVSGEQVFKIVSSNDWYIALYPPVEFVYDWKEGDSRTVYIEHDEAYRSLNMTVDRLVKTDGGKECYLLLRSAKNMTDFMDIRSVKVKLSDSGHEGLKIPLSAIVNKTLIIIPNEFINGEENPTVTRKGADADETVPITAKDSDESYTYIYQDTNGSVRIGDTLVRNGDTTQTLLLSQVDNVRGVFVLNNGYADFVKLEDEGELPEKGGYVVLDAELNSGIRVNDRIIFDTKNITDGQRVE